MRSKFWWGSMVATPEVWWVTLKEFTEGELAKHIFRETDCRNKPKNLIPRWTGKNVFQSKMQGSFPCSLDSTHAAKVHVPHHGVLGGLEIRRKYFGRGCPGWVSWFSVWEALLSVMLNSKGQNVVGPWLSWGWVTNDQNSHSVQSSPPQLQGQGTTWLCTFTFLLSLIKEGFVHQPSKCPAAWCVWCAAQDGQPGNVVEVLGCRASAEMGRSPVQIKQNAELSWKMRDRA